MKRKNKMRNWLLLMRDVVWTAVLAVVFAVLSIGVALFAPDLSTLTLAFGFSSVAFASLAQRG
jgi:uncharacterized membrane protein